MSEPTQTQAEAQLEAHRARIDTLDDSIIKLLHERTGIVKEVGALKSQNWPNNCHIRPGREGRMHRAIAERFKNADFSVKAAVSIWRQIIGASTNVESPLSVAYYNRTPHHAWLAREYFGVQIQHTGFDKLEDALAAINDNTCNVLFMPMPAADNVQHWKIVVNRAPALKIFATLPVMDSPLPGNVEPALALSAIAPEDSGDDTSYYLLPASHTIRMLDGFVPPSAPAAQALGSNAVFLGAHPRALHIS